MASAPVGTGIRSPLASLENRAGYAPVIVTAAAESCAETVLQDEALRLQNEIDELSVRALSRHVQGPSLLLDRVLRDLVQLRPKISSSEEARDGRDEARNWENGASLSQRLMRSETTYGVLERRLAATLMKISRVVEAAEAQQQQQQQVPSFVEQVIAEHDEASGFADAWERQEPAHKERKVLEGHNGKCQPVTKPVHLNNQTPLSNDAEEGPHRAPNHNILSRALTRQVPPLGF